MIIWELRVAPPPKSKEKNKNKTATTYFFTHNIFNFWWLSMSVPCDCVTLCSALRSQGESIFPLENTGFKTEQRKRAWDQTPTQQNEISVSDCSNGLVKGCDVSLQGDQGLQGSLPLCLEGLLNVSAVEVSWWWERKSVMARRPLWRVGD